MDFSTWWKYASPLTKRRLRVFVQRSPSYLNWVRNGGKPSAETALKIEEFTDGAVMRYELRPDLFSRQEHEASSQD